MPTISSSVVTPGRVAILATGIAALFAGWDLGARSLWLDEAYTVEIAGASWAHLWERVTTAEASMTFYYVALHPWLALGHSEAMVRAFSALMLVLTVPLAYWVGVRLIGATAAAVGVMLLATNAFVLRYGQEARSYTLVVFLVVASSLALLRAVERPTKRRWTMWVIAAVLAAYTHPLGILAVGAQVLAVVRRVPLRVLTPALVAVGVLVAPLFWFFLTHDVGQTRWITTPSVADIVPVLGRLTGTDGRLGIAAYAVCIMAAAWHGGFGVRFLLTWAVLPFALTFAISAVKPLFVDRYFLMLVPAVALLAGDGLATVRWRALRVAAVIALVALQMASVPRVLATPAPENWREVAAMIRADPRPDQAAACWADFVCVSLEYYFAPPRGGPPIIPLAAAVNDPAAMEAITASHSRLWLAISHVPADMEDRRAMLGRIETMLTGTYALTDTRELAGVTLRRYDRRSTASLAKLAEH